MEVENYYWIEIKSNTSFNKLKKTTQKLRTIYTYIVLVLSINLSQLLLMVEV